jgi:hypothetical protein
MRRRRSPRRAPVHGPRRTGLALCLGLSVVACGDRDRATPPRAVDTSASAPQRVIAPDTLVQRFFAAYLADVEASRDPLRPDGVLRRDVAPALLDSLRDLEQRGEVLDSDPFLLVQDWPDDWRTSISAVVTSPTGSPDSVRVRLRLGRTDSTAVVRDVLLVSVVAEWKIRSVRAH